MSDGLAHQKAAVDAGIHPLYRFDPRKQENGEPMLRLDSKKPTVSLLDFMANEGRFQMLRRRDPERAAALCASSQAQLERHFDLLAEWAKK